MLLRYKPCWVTYGEERKEGRKEARANPYICKKKKSGSKKKESGVCGDEWSTDYLPQDA